MRGIELVLGDGSNLVQSALIKYINAHTERLESVALNGVGFHYQVMLPVIMKNYTPPTYKDLTISQIEIIPDSPTQGITAEIRVHLTNIGTQTVPSGFWVDLYINPVITPTVGTPCCRNEEYGIAWRIRESIEPGETIILSSFEPNDPLHPDDNFSHWPGYFPIDGDVSVYALADSMGWIRESDEGNNRHYQNVFVLEGDVSNTSLDSKIPIQQR